MEVAAMELGVEVVFAVAEADDIKPEEVDAPLHAAINPDALDALFEQPTTSVEFQYAGYLVTVHGTGEIQLSELP